MRIVYEVENNRRRFLDIKVLVGEGGLIIKKEDISTSIGVKLDIKTYKSLS